MSAGVFEVFDRAITKIAGGVIDLDSHAFKLALCDSSQALAVTFAGGSTDCRYADLTGELANGSGYTTGGVAMAGMALSRLGSVVTFDATDSVFAALTKTGIKYAVMYDNTNANKDLLGFLEVNTGGTLDTSGGDFTVEWNAAGLFTITRTT